MRRLRLMSLRTRLLLLVLLAIVPIAALLLYTNLEDRQRATADAQAAAVSDVQILRANLEQVATSARQLLMATQIIGTAGAGLSTCEAQLAQLNRLEPDYSQLGVAALNGDIVCSSVPLTPTVVADQVAWFQRAIETRAFSVGDYQTSPETGQPSLMFSYPILNDHTEVQGVVFAELPLSKLHDRIAKSQLAGPIDLITIDRNGTILDRSPQPDGWIGRTLPEAPLIQRMLTQHQGVAEETGIDGEPRVYVFEPVGTGMDTGLHVCAGISRDVILAEPNAALWRNLVALGVIGATGLVIAGWFANRLILQPVNSLISITQRLRHGDLSARSEEKLRVAEVNELAATLNEMAAALEERDAQRQAAEDTLREQRELLHVTLSSIGDAVIAADAASTITFMNPRAEALTGWRQADAVGQALSTVFVVAHEGTQRATEDPMQLIMQTGPAVFTNHTVLLPRSGGEIAIDISGAPIRNNLHDLMGVILVFRDITRRRRTERRSLTQYSVARLLAESDQLSAVAPQVLQTIGAGIGWQTCTLWCVARDSQVLQHELTWQSPARPNTALQAANQAHPLQPNEDLPGRVWAIGRSLWSRDVEQDERFKRAAAALNSGLRAAVVVPLRSRNAVIGALECLSDRPQSPDDELLTMLETLGNQLGNFIERVEAEEALYNTNMILQAVFEGTTDSIYVKDKQGQYLLVNSAAAQVVGRPASDIIGHDDTYLSAPETAQQIRAEDQRVMSGQRAQTFEDVIRVSGERRVYHAVKAPYSDAQGKVVGLIGIARDVTDLKRVEQAQRLLAEASRQLTTSLNDQTRLANAAHALIPDLADWCAIDVIDTDQTVWRLGAVHIDPAKTALLENVYRRSPPDWHATAGVPYVLNTGQSQFWPDVTDERLLAAGHTPDQLRELRELGQASVIIAPLIAHGQILGAMTLGRSAAQRRYTREDVDLAEELARRFALALDNARLYTAEATERAEAEAAQQRLLFLAEASRALMTATDVDTLLENLTRFLVPTLADWCALNLVEPDGSIGLAKAAHRESDKTLRIYELAEESPLEATAVLGIERMLRTGLPETSSRAATDHLTELGENGGYLQRLEDLGFSSYMIVPLRARGRIIGAMTLVSANAGRPYTRTDLTLAEDLAAQAALAVDNAQLYQEAQQLNAELEQRVRERTALLQANNERLQQQIADRLRAEAELAEVRQQLAQHGEDQRLQLAKQLHDGPVQDLYGISYRLASLNDTLADQAPLDQLVAAQAELQQVIHILRNISTDLLPPTLTPFGLVIAVRSYADRFQAANPDLRLHLDLMPDQQQLPEAVRQVLYRVYQQMLSNVVRHAQAQRVTVRFAMTDSEAVLEVQDDGRGFIVPDRWIDLARQGHLGLIGAAERVEALGGTFKVTSAPGAGTHVRVSVPLTTTLRNAAAPEHEATS